MVDRINESDVQIKETLYMLKGKVEVYKVQMFRGGDVMCMKKIFVENVYDATAINSECLAMAQYQHPNIVRLIASSFGGVNREITHVNIFMEYFERGDLEKLIVDSIKLGNYFPQEQILEFMRQLVSAYAYLQKRNVAHRDIKPQNIFVSIERGAIVLKVGDLGSAVKKDKYSGVTLTGTPLYLSPKLREAFVNSHNDGFNNVLHDVYKSDVFSLGLTFLYLASLKDVKDLSGLQEIEKKIKARINNLHESYDFLKKLLAKMLEIDENKRPGFIELEILLARSEPNPEFVVNYQNINDIPQGNILELKAKCESCGQIKDENDVYAFSSGIICVMCYNNFIRNIKTDNIFQKNNFGTTPINSLDAINGAVICKYCKCVQHPGLTCMENVEKGINPGPLIIQCKKCSSFVTERYITYFVSCENIEHSFCIVCNTEFNSSNHEACILLFSGLNLS